MLLVNLYNLQKNQPPTTEALTISAPPRPHRRRKNSQSSATEILMLCLVMLASVTSLTISLSDEQQVRSRCGSPLPRIIPREDLPHWIHEMTANEVAEAVIASPVPASFDPLVQWPYCKSIIGHVRNQGPCGDCWAFGMFTVCLLGYNTWSGMAWFLSTSSSNSSSASMFTTIIP